MARLSDAEVSVALNKLPGWSVDDDQLVKTYSFSTFPDAVAFVTRVADVAEDMGHHPDILIQYSAVTMRLSTHSEGGITDKDTQLARRLDGLLGR
jgi:4a-hydroxytetrahydrobiopterin dehydratase